MQMELKIVFYAAAMRTIQRILNFFIVMLEVY